MERTRDSIEHWTEAGESSVTSRQALARERSFRVRILEEDEEEEERREAVRPSRVLIMAASGFRLFLKGRWASPSSSELRSGRRRFLLSAMEEREMEVKTEE